MREMDEDEYEDEDDDEEIGGLSDRFILQGDDCRSFFAGDRVFFSFSCFTFSLYLSFSFFATYFFVLLQKSFLKKFLFIFLSRISAIRFAMINGLKKIKEGDRLRGKKKKKKARKRKKKQRKEDEGRRYIK